jgi:hypothetical protein
VTIGAVFSGCSSKEAEKGTSTDGGTALSLGDGAAGPRIPESIFEAGVPISGDYCAFLVAAECDGNEDCGPGQTCCGILDGGALRYNSIKCQDTCDAAAGGFQLCHKGDACPGAGDAGTADAAVPTCHRSLVLPPYLAICSVPNPLLPNDLSGPPAAAHEINCGDTLTCGAGTKCCVLGNWDSQTQQTSMRTGYCAPADAECDCTKAPQSDGG